MDSFLSKISTKRSRYQGGDREAHYVRIPDDWATARVREGYTHVWISERAHGTKELVLTPLRAADVKEYRRQRRIEKSRERARRRYQ